MSTVSGSGSSDTPNPPTIGEVADKVQALGTYNHVGPDGTVWRLKYLGEVLLPDWLAADGIYRPFPDVKP